jgi:hypothetical protein
MRRAVDLELGVALDDHDELVGAVHVVGPNLARRIDPQPAREAALGGDIIAQLDSVTVGDGTDGSVLDRALSGVDVVLSERGTDPRLATELSAAVKRNSVQKLCWPARITNVLADDGVSPSGASASRTHQVCGRIKRQRPARVSPRRAVGF